MGAAERDKARSDFLGLAGQAERLLKTDPASTTYDSGALRRFQNVFADELEQIVRWRDDTIAKPVVGSVADFDECIAYAREVLKHWNDPRADPSSTGT